MALDQLLRSYREVLDRAESIDLEPLSRKARALAAVRSGPRPVRRWFLLYFLTGHVARRLDTLARAHYAGAVRGSGSTRAKECAEDIGTVRSSVPPIHGAAAVATLLVLSIVLLPRLIRFGEAEYMIETVDSFAQLNATGFVTAASRTDVSNLVGAAALLGFSAFVVLFWPVRGFARKRLLMNTPHITAEQVATAPPRSWGRMAEGVYEREREAFHEAGLRIPREFPYDIVHTAIIAMPALVGGFVALVIGVVDRDVGVGALGCGALVLWGVVMGKVVSDYRWRTSGRRIRWVAGVAVALAVCAGVAVFAGLNRSAVREVITQRTTSGAFFGRIDVMQRAVPIDRYAQERRVKLRERPNPDLPAYKERLRGGPAPESGEPERAFATPVSTAAGRELGAVISFVIHTRRKHDCSCRITWEAVDARTGTPVAGGVGVGWPDREIEIDHRVGEGIGQIWVPLPRDHKRVFFRLSVSEPRGTRQFGESDVVEVPRGSRRRAPLSPVLRLSPPG